MKDNFSTESHLYAQYRPTYPNAFFQYLKSIVNHTQYAWDCGTGNGQVAFQLADFFTQVYATDISAAQLEQAKRLPNISYSVQPAEATNFGQNFFDLVIVAQAIHWFNFNQFYAEVNRTAKKNALIVVLGYGKLSINPLIDRVVEHLYADILETYWDPERKYIDEGYQTIPFPFKSISAPPFESSYEWTLPHLIGYLNTWSAVKHYIKEKGANPVDAVYKDLEKHWDGAEKRKVTFPLLLRIGQIK